TLIVVTVNLLRSLIQATMARRWASEHVVLPREGLAADRKAMLRLISFQLPNTIFYCFYGQVTVVVISIFGNSTQIAEVGAVGRLGAIFTILGSIMSTIALPWFARTQCRGALARKYAQILVAYAAGGLTLLILASLARSQLLWLLGPKYAGLEPIVGWIIASA